MRNTKLVVFVYLSISLFSHHANATLIGDEVTCSFTLVTLFTAGGPCTTDPEMLVPGPATVTNQGLDNPEYFIGTAVPLFGVPFVTGASVDIGPNYVELVFEPSLTGLPGYMQVWVSSLDWLIPINDIVVESNLSASQLTVSTGPTSVVIEARTQSLPENTRVRVSFVSSPGTILFVLPTFLFFFLSWRKRRESYDAESKICF